MPGSITASPAIGEATWKTPRRRCVSARSRRAIRRQAPISAPSCASPASRRDPRRCSGKPSSASRAMPGRGSSSPICSEANAPPKRWRSLMLPRRRPAMCRRERHWHLQHSLALLQLGRTGGGARRARCVRGARPVPPRNSRCSHCGGLCCSTLARTTRNALWPKPGVWNKRLRMSAPELLPKHRIMAHFDLAKFWSNTTTSHA